MDVDASEARERQNGFRQDLSVRRDDDDLRRKGGKISPRVGRTDLCGLKNRQIELARRNLDGRRTQLHFAAGGPIRLGKDSLEFHEAARGKGLQRWNSDGSSAKKDNAHGRRRGASSFR